MKDRRDEVRRGRQGEEEIMGGTIRTGGEGADPKGATARWAIYQVVSRKEATGDIGTTAGTRTPGPSEHRPWKEGKVV